MRIAEAEEVALRRRARRAQARVGSEGGEGAADGDGSAAEDVRPSPRRVELFIERVVVN